MHIDARKIENHSIIEGDICIVGAGAAGISIALDWIDTPYKIILLEGGGFEYDEKVQKLYDGNITGQNYYPMMSSRLHYFGGTTGHWGGLCAIFDEIDFLKRDWVNQSGWPIRFKDLGKFYAKAHPILDLGPYNYDPNYWKNVDPSSEPLPLDETAIKSKIFQQSAPTRFGKKFKETIVKANNIHLFTYANATEIQANDAISNITQITVKNYAGKTHYVKAKKYILACSAIENARLLLASNKQTPAGIGNNNDLVGRYFMEHLEIKTGELWLNHSRELSFYKWNPHHRAELAVSAIKQKELKILNGTISLNPLEIENKKTPNIISWSDKDPRKSHESFDEYASKARDKNLLERLFSSNNFQAFGLYTRLEQSPNPLSRAMLNNEVDSLGVPKIDLHWAFSPIDKRSMRELNKLVGQQVGKAGIGRVRLYDFLLDKNDDSMPDYTSGGWHHMGTTKMNDDPKNGVVDANCKVHGIANLFVAGASCFATAGAVTPTLNLVALSLRLSDHLKGQNKIT